MVVVYTSFFKADLNRLKKQQLYTVLDNTLDAIVNMKEAVTINEIRELKQLNRAKNSYRVRIDDYRICFRLYRGKIKLYHVDKRDIIYKRFP